MVEFNLPSSTLPLGWARMNREEFLSCLGEDYQFRVANIVAEEILPYGLSINPERMTVAYDAIRSCVRAVLRIATQEEDLHEYPADWWQAFKQRWFPKWLLRRYPVRKLQVWAIHKYPELAIPKEFFGQEFVHLRLVDERKLNKIIEGRSYEQG